jgi:nitrate reductase delta subunit
MASPYKVLSALLSYPTEDLQADAAEIAGLVRQTEELSEPVRQGLAELVLDLSNADLIDSQSRYVDLFDRSRSLSLHLFEHVYGESRDRGQAMVDLRQRYRDAGLDIASNELPDYLPLLLEFLAQRPDEEARQLLGDAAHVLRALRERLDERGNIYAPVFAALEELGQRAPDAEQLAAMRSAKIDDPSDLAALDRVWQETEVQFGPNGFGETECPSARPAARV